MKKIELHSVSKKQLKQIHTWLRAAIQLLYFIFIPSVYTAGICRSEIHIYTDWSRRAD